MSVYLHRDEKRVCLRTQDLTTERIKLIFQVSPETVYLKEEFSDLVIIPDIDGSFQLAGLQDGHCYDVEGSPLQSSTTSRLWSSTSSPVTATSAPVSNSLALSYSPAFSSVLASGSGHAKRNLSFSLKVVLAKMTHNGAKVEFIEEDQTFVTLTEATANVPHITAIVKDAFNKPDIVLVTSNGLAVKDSSGTQGLMFWKVPSRKIYAIRKEEAKGTTVRPKRKHKECEYNNEDDLDFLKSQIVELGRVVQGMSVKLDEMHQLTVSKGEGMKAAIDQFLKCKICLSSPAQAPCVSSCCEIVIGCATCLDRWLEEDEERGCPCCRAARFDFKPVKLRGVDTIVQAIY